MLLIFLMWAFTSSTDTFSSLVAPHKVGSTLRLYRPGSERSSNLTEFTRKVHRTVGVRSWPPTPAAVIVLLKSCGNELTDSAEAGAEERMGACF